VGPDRSGGAVRDREVAAPLPSGGRTTDSDRTDDSWSGQRDRARVDREAGSQGSDDRTPATVRDAVARSDGQAGRDSTSRRGDDRGAQTDRDGRTAQAGSSGRTDERGRGSDGAHGTHGTRRDTGRSEAADHGRDAGSNASAHQDRLRADGPGDRATRSDGARNHRDDGGQERRDRSARTVTETRSGSTVHAPGSGSHEQRVNSGTREQRTDSGSRERRSDSVTREQRGHPGTREQRGTSDREQGSGDDTGHPTARDGGRDRTDPAAVPVRHGDEGPRDGADPAAGSDEDDPTVLAAPSE
jgi:hypothetical protein